MIYIKEKREEKREEFAQPKCVLEYFDCRTRSRFLANLLLLLALPHSNLKSQSTWREEKEWNGMEVSFLLLGDVLFIGKANQPRPHDEKKQRD